MQRRWQTARRPESAILGQRRRLVWDFTCPDTLAAGDLNRAVSGPGAVANEAEARKSVKYQSLAALYNFTLVAVETLGAT